MIGAGAALLRIDGAIFPNGADKGFLHGTVGGEEGCVFAIGGNLPWHVLGNKLLCTRDTSVAGGIGGVDFYQFDTEFSAGFLHDLKPTGNGGVRQMAGE